MDIKLIKTESDYDNCVYPQRYNTYGMSNVCENATTQEI